MADVETLVTQIKQLQRSDETGKQAWRDYCDQNLNGMKDPARHSAEVLQGFLDYYLSGGFEPASLDTTKPAGVPIAARKQTGNGANFGGWGDNRQGMGMGWNAAGGGQGGQGSLQEFIKLGQRRSQAWKSAWGNYTQLFGNGRVDPAVYDDGFIVGFIDYIGNLTTAALPVGGQYGPGNGGGMAANTRGPQDFGGPKRIAPFNGTGPPAKKPVPPRTDWATQGEDGGFGFDMSGFGAESGMDGAPQKEVLVQKIKELQRSGSEAKQAWLEYCDGCLGGVKDPNRHDVDTLVGFLHSVGESC